MSSEDSSREDHRDHDCAHVDNAGMVYRRAESVDRANGGFPGDQRCSTQSSSTRS